MTTRLAPALLALALVGCLSGRSGTVGTTDTTTDTDTAVTTIPDATTDDDTAVTTIPDGTHADDTAVTTIPDGTTPTDAADTAIEDVGLDATPDDPCEPPLRLSPRRGPVAGGTTVRVVGQEFYIGALTWMLKIGDAPATEVHWELQGGDEGPCVLYFTTTASPTAGTWDAFVYYGYGEPTEPAPDPPRSDYAGPFTYE